MNRYTENYTYPKLCSRSGDVTKQWYVYFFWLENDQKKQIRVKRGLNLIKNKKEREQEGKILVQVVLNQLNDGWNPITDQMDKKLENKTVSEWLDDILLLKKSYITDRSYRTYKDNIKFFKSWLKLKKLDDLFVHNFTNKHAQQFLDWILVDKGFCGKTHNGYLGNISGFFNEIEKRNKSVTNPFKGIKKLPEDVGSNTTYSVEEQNLLEKYFIENDKYFYFATRFVKYCFFRRTELSLLQVKHIMWYNKTIVVPSKSAKSRKQDSVTIGKTLEKIIKESGIINLDPQMYVFGKDFIPSFEKIKRLDDFSDKQRDINKMLGVKPECTFYSWKHTGCVELYNITTDPYVVMRQCRHSEINITMRYLRSLGLGVNEQVRAW